MVRSDNWWKAFGPSIIDSYAPDQVRTIDNGGVVSSGMMRSISYGTSSAGYDLRLSPDSCQIFDAGQSFTGEIDPKAFDGGGHLMELEYRAGLQGDYFRIPAHGYALAVTMETITMPADHIGIVIGKSTYARSGLFVNTTPLEPGWRGRLVLELANLTPLPLRVYAGEGIAQLLMLACDQRPAVTYADRSGKYQDQRGIVTARV